MLPADSAMSMSGDRDREKRGPGWTRAGSTSSLAALAAADLHELEIHVSRGIIQEQSLAQCLVMRGRLSCTFPADSLCVRQLLSVCPRFVDGSAARPAFGDMSALLLLLSLITARDGV